jgi:hypothetical protein
MRTLVWKSQHTTFRVIQGATLTILSGLSEGRVWVVK